MRIFATYSAVIVLGFLVATHQGYAMSSMFGRHHHGSEPGGYHGSSYFYHK